MSFTKDREHMIEAQLAERGISDRRLLEAFLAVPRERFVPEGETHLAYCDAPLPIGEGQTISQPYIVAFTLDALRLQGHERALEVGTGSGYAAAVLGHLVREVITVERIPALAVTAAARLAELALHNVRVELGDGSLGWPEGAPYDAIAVAASSPSVPMALLEQLVIGGRLVIPVGFDETSQSLVRVVREGPTDYREEPLVHVRFVPLIGAQGWPDAAAAAEQRAPHREDVSPGSAPRSSSSLRDRMRDLARRALPFRR
jgi:protein-L-isoaspartate(D-aspartate) O-methyltransferase